MPQATCNGLQIEYETLGDPNHPPIVLIMGLAAQLVRWPMPFCEALVAKGRYLIRFDNRDVGLSSKIEGVPLPNLVQVWSQKMRGERPDVPYTLEDMAADTFGLMDALGLEAAHVVGVSLGGAIAQVMTLQHPERVLTLTSIMSTSGRPGLPVGQRKATEWIMSVRPTEREGFVSSMVETDQVLAGPVPIDRERARESAARSFDRCCYPPGPARQLVAMAAAPSRHESLRGVRVPSLVIHGTLDPLVPVESGRDVAACIPGARYIEIADMGHFMPGSAWPTIVDAIALLTGQP